RRGQDEAPRQHARSDRGLSSRPDQAKMSSHVAEVTDAAEAALSAHRWEREVEVDQRALGGPQLGGPLRGLEPIRAVAAPRNGSVERLAAEESDPLEHRQ